ncbi:MAG: hypothetical protein Q8P63_00375 [Candidatus Nealsonbacteria bacterium]|nr:hypothetical protein [Candidatus Nealsonbacteria bacterium]
MEKEKGQSEVIFIVLFVIGVFVVLNLTGVLGGGKDKEDKTSSGNKANNAQQQLNQGNIAPPSSTSNNPPPGKDEVPPQRFNLSPAGVLTAGTYETQLSLNTNESAYCRYSKIPNTLYGSMDKTFSRDETKLFHTIIVAGLEDNRIHEYYVRCQDSNNNKNTDDAVIRFGVGGVANSPSSPTQPGQDVSPPYRYNELPDEKLPSNTKETIISLKTDEKAVCRYETVSGVSFGAMRRFTNTDSLYHSTQVLGLSEGEIREYYIKCEDEYNNINADDFVIIVEIELLEDLIPPVRTYLYPDSDLAAGTTATNLMVYTNEPATCRYDKQQGVVFNSMKYSFSKKDINTYSAQVSGLEDGITYNFFVKCKDTEGNINPGDVMIRFKVGE